MPSVHTHLFLSPHPPFSFCGLTLADHGHTRWVRGFSREATSKYFMGGWIHVSGNCWLVCAYPWAVSNTCELGMCGSSLTQADL